MPQNNLLTFFLRKPKIYIIDFRLCSRFNEYILWQVSFLRKKHPTIYEAFKIILNNLTELSQIKDIYEFDTHFFY